MTAILPHGGTLVDKIITGPEQKHFCRLQENCFLSV